MNVKAGERKENTRNQTALVKYGRLPEVRKTYITGDTWDSLMKLHRALAWREGNEKRQLERPSKLRWLLLLLLLLLCLRFKGVYLTLILLALHLTSLAMCNAFLTKMKYYFFKTPSICQLLTIKIKFYISECFCLRLCQNLAVPWVLLIKATDG